MNKIASRTLLGALALGLTVAGAAQADTGNLLECVNRGFVLQRCKLQNVELAKPGTDVATPFETEYAVTYDFPCFGNSTTLGVRAGEDTRYFRMGARGETLSGIRSSEPISTFDPTPEVTARLSYRPGCSVVVQSVTASPSNGTIALWSTEARAQARIVTLARDLYLLSRNFVAIATFNRDQLAVVIDAAQKRMDAGTSPIDRRKWQALRDSLVAIRDGQPIPVPKQEFDQYLTDLAATSRADMLAEADIARAMVSRFETWQLAVEASLHDALEHLPSR